MGPVNPEAFAWIEPWLLDTLPTAEPQATRLARLDGAWWHEHGASARADLDSWFGARPVLSRRFPRA
jgi:hypothetical protein